MFATVTVTSIADAAANPANCPGANCTLRDALAKALPGDTINFGVTGTITLTAGELIINNNLTINGPGANALTIDANQKSRVLRVNANNVVDISGLTFTNGKVDGCDAEGGGIFSSGTLTLRDCVLTNNEAIQGGGIVSDFDRTLNLYGCTVSNNKADQVGGVIANSGTLNVINSTISGNQATSGAGGGLACTFNLLLQINLVNSTITGNSSGSYGGGIELDGPLVQMKIKNSIIAGNTALFEPDFANWGTVTSLGNNLLGSVTTYTGGTFTSQASDLMGANPMLLALANNGGTTPTHLLVPGSPAIDAGDNCVLTNSCAGLTLNAALANDQRGAGFPRKVGSAVDIGAFESFLKTCPSSFTVNSLLDVNDSAPGDGVCATAGGVCTLRAAIQEANAISFCSPLVINFNVTGTILLNSGELAIAHPNLKVNGPGANVLTIDANQKSRIFNVSANVLAEISGLTITRGKVEGRTAEGGGIYSDGTLTLRDCVVSYNEAFQGGGIVSNFDDTLNLYGCTVANNKAVQVGGVIANSGTLNVVNSTISGNQATGGAGGGLACTYNVAMQINLVNSTITGNSSSSYGGGVELDGPLVQMKIKNSIIAVNTAPNGPDFANFGTVTSLGNNLFGSFNNYQPGTFTGNGSDLTGVNPLLDALANNGGSTATHALMSGSLALNAGDNCVLTNSCANLALPAALSNDQRGPGFPRKVGGAVDIGAYESGQTMTLVSSVNPSFVGQPVTFTTTINSIAGTPTGTVQFKVDGAPLGLPVVATRGSVSGLPAGKAVAAGLITASITTSALTAGNRTITAEYSGDANFPASSAALVQVIGSLSGSVTDPLSCTSPGNVLNVSAQVVNPASVAQNLSFTAAPNANLLALSGTCVASLGTCTVVNANTVTWTGSLPANATLTINYQVQVADAALPGAQLCVDSTASFNNGAPANVVACGTVNCPGIGPGTLPNGQNAASNQKPGSVLLYNLVASSASNASTQNARISLTNTNPTRTAYVHLFFVDGSNCTVADSFICLTPNQTATFLHSDVDPGTTGYLVAVATDRSGCPITFNYLIGDEFVKLSSGHAANLGAEAIAARAGSVTTCAPTAADAVLRFDDVSYDAVPRVLALDNFASPADGNQTLVVINRVGGFLSTGAFTTGTLFGLLYDDAEQALSFSLGGGCQVRATLNGATFRTTPRVEQFIPTGRSGWLKLYSNINDFGILGAALNFNANAATQAAAFNQGHNLHKLRLSQAAVYTIPVFPPSC